MSKHTIRNWRSTRDKLASHFGPDCDMRTIRPGDCDDWRQWLVDSCAEATMAQHVENARHYFRVAKRKGVVDANPFEDIRGGSQTNSARQHFVDRETVEKVMSAAPDDEWRLIIALSRFGGVRTPSETTALQWDHIDWAEGRISMPSPKTAKRGKPFRVAPLFPELRPHLTRAFERAPEGAIYVVQKNRDDAANWRTQLLRIIRRAGGELGAAVSQHAGIPPD